MKIEKEEVLLREGIVVEKATVRDDENNVFPRYRVNRPDVAAVLLFNTDTQKIILTRQFRYAVAAKMPESILEIVAGRLDAGETPEAAALRETEEEAGYHIRPEQLSLLVSCFASPGYSSERLNIYYAAVTDADKLKDGGGGLKNEHEYIELVELTTAEFRHLLQEGGIQDAKTYVAGLYVAFYRRNFL